MAKRKAPRIRIQKTKELLLRIVGRLGEKGKGTLPVDTWVQEARTDKLFRTRKDFYNTCAILKRSGYLEIVRPQSTKSLVRITEKGWNALQTYRLSKRIQERQRWDGCWRLVVFDVPEEVHGLRDHFRRLLKGLGFQMLQASVWVCPYDIFDELEQLIPDLKRHGWIKLLVVKEVIGIGPDYLKRKFGL